MSTGSITMLETYTSVVCASCGVTFALLETHERNLRRKHSQFYCPNGHTLCFHEKSDVDKERERAERLQEQLKRREADLQAERNWHRSTKAQLTKTKKRVANGVCPCCNRSFVNLQRHMTGQHPGYQDTTP